MKLCKCGCGEEIIFKSHHKWYGEPNFIWGHHSKGKNNPMYGIHMKGEKHPMYGKRNLRLSEFNHITKKGKPLSEEHKRKIGRKGKEHPMYGKRGKDCPLFGRKHSEETKKKMCKNNAKYWLNKHHSIEHRRKISRTITGRRKFTLEQIENNLKDIFISKSKIKKIEFLKGKDIGRIACATTINRILKDNNTNLDDLVHKLGFSFDKTNKWKEKQDFIEEVIRKQENNIRTQQFYKGIGILDIETDNMIYDAKSYYYNGWRKIKERYERLGKPVKFIVFEDRGKTDVSKEDIILVTSLIKGNSPLIERYNRILNNIDINQKSLNETKI